jgi:hypothetical protein
MGILSLRGALSERSESKGDEAISKSGKEIASLRSQ